MVYLQKIDYLHQRFADGSIPHAILVMEKKRAKNNRTLTVEPDEIEHLQRLITPVEQLTVGLDFDNRIIQGDLLCVLDRIPDGVADLIIIDPPYNLSKNFHGLNFQARSHDAYLAYLRSWFHRVCAKLKPAGSLYLCGDWRCTAALQTVMSEELTVLNRITWQREKGKGAMHNWKNGMEDIWFGVKDARHYYFDVEAVKQKRRVIAPYRQNGKPKDWEATSEGNFRLTYPSNFWDDISVPFWSMPENTDHPTQKPEKLYAKLILASSREGDLVFDPFLGSGTAAVVAKKLNRRYLGVELNGEYCLWAAKRLCLAEQDASIQGYVDGVFWERNTLAVQRSHTALPDEE